MKRFAEGASRIFLACGFTDFRKQIPGLVATVTLNFKLDPYNSSYVFIFCNRRKDSIKVLRYDYNGFVLATKKLLDDMKFQWPRTPDEVKEITFQQVEWLLQGLEMNTLIFFLKLNTRLKISHMKRKNRSVRKRQGRSLMPFGRGQKKPPQCIP